MTDMDLDTLADWLEDEQRNETCLDIHGLHGYLTALVICGEPLDDGWLAEALDADLQDLPTRDAQWFADQSLALYHDIEQALYSDDQVPLTFIPTVDWEDSPMQRWCEAFMEVVFARPDQWVHDKEDNLSTLLLPIETASGLFADEPDFKPIYRNAKLLKQMVDQIPELLTDLYLLLHSPQRL